MSDGRASPIKRRLRDERGEVDSPAGRAGVVIRGVAPPAPLTVAADARILAALSSGTRARSLRTQRFVFAAVAAGLCLAVVASGAGAAALAWLRGPPRPTVEPLAGITPVPTPVQETAPARPVRVPEVVTRTVTPATTAPERAFTRARLAIDPDDRPFRLQLPPDFARAHAGRAFRWRVDVCVSAAGTVVSARAQTRVHPVLDREVVQAIRKWRYLPAQKAGRAVRSCLSLDYNLTVRPVADP